LRKVDQKVSASEGPMPRPMISRRPSVGGDGDYGCDRDNAAALADLEVGGVEPQVGPFALEGTVEEGAYPLVDLLAQLGDLALRDAGDGSQEVAFAALLQKLRQWQSVLGHRGILGRG
jgi:hypothetical protein